MRILLVCSQSCAGLLMGVNPATNKHEDCKPPFVSVWLYCCSDDNVIYSHRNKFQESRAVCKKSFHFHLKQR